MLQHYHEEDQRLELEKKHQATRQQAKSIEKYLEQVFSLKKGYNEFSQLKQHSNKTSNLRGATLVFLRAVKSKESFAE